jgi:hypothetical protein
MAATDADARDRAAITVCCTIWRMSMTRRAAFLSVFALPLLALHDAHAALPLPIDPADTLLVLYPAAWHRASSSTLRRLQGIVSERWPKGYLIMPDENVGGVEYQILSKGPHGAFARII